MGVRRGRPCSIIESDKATGDKDPCVHVRGAANVRNATDRTHILLLENAHRGGEAPVRISISLIHLAPSRTIRPGPAHSAIARTLLLDKK
jgi:hypothetical protein